MTQNDRFPVSVIILTLNESANIANCLSRLGWADEVILVDSHSSDDTVDRAVKFRNDLRVFQNHFEDFGQQRNWALDNTRPRHDWILFVDADERMTPACRVSIQRAVNEPNEKVGYFLCYRNIFLGRWIKHCTHFPSWQLRLLRRGRVRYQKEGHGQREILDGPAGYILEPFDHLDVSKGLTEWISKHNSYSSQEIDLMCRLRNEPLRLRELFGQPIERRRCLKRISARVQGNAWIWFIYTYLFRCGFLDGKQGLVFCQLRLAQQIHVRAKLYEAERNGRLSPSQNGETGVDFHDRLAENWDAKYQRRAFVGRREAVTSLLHEGPLAGQHWLDAGCGSGYFSRYLAGLGCKVEGVDASAGMIQTARKLASRDESASRLQFNQIESLERMAVSAGAFDGALCISVLEYLPDPKGALGKLRTALKPGGLLLISVPNRRSLLRKLLCAIFRATTALAGKGWPAYLRYSKHSYTLEEFTEVLAENGFEAASSTYHGGPMPRSMQRRSWLGSLFVVKARRTGDNFAIQSEPEKAAVEVNL